MRQLYGLFSCHVLDVHAEQCYAWHSFVNLVLQIEFMATRCIVASQQAEGFHSLAVIFYYMDTPESYHAAEIGGELGGMHVVAVYHTKGTPLILPHCINFVPLAGRMKVEVVVVIDEAQRYGVGIAAIAYNGKDAGGGTA